MDTKTLNPNQEERHFVDTTPSSKILEGTRFTARRKFMARFFDGKWEGNIYEVIPVEKYNWIHLPSRFAEHKIRITFPYLTQNKIKFVVKEIDREASFKPFTEIQIYEHYRLSGATEYKTRAVKMDDKFSGDKRTITIDRELTFAWPGNVIYSIDKPESDKYIPLLSVDLWTDDEIQLKIFYLVMGVLIGAIASPISLLLAGLLKIGN